MTQVDSVVPTVPGTPFGGGFFVGRTIQDGKTFALILAPKDGGEAESIQWKKSYTDTPGTLSVSDGFANSEAMNDDDHPAAQFCRAVRAGGHDDWYLPSRDELELVYRNLKPGTGQNYTYASRAKAWGVEPGKYNGVDEQGNGHNASSDPAGAAYTADDPFKTLAEAFQSGGPEALAERWYWSSTQFSSDTAWVQDFEDGYQGHNFKDDSFRCRAVRKILI